MKPKQTVTKEYKETSIYIINWYEENKYNESNL